MATNVLKVARPETHSGARLVPLHEFVAALRPQPREAFLGVRALAIGLGADVVETVSRDVVTYARRQRPFVLAEVERSRIVIAFPVDLWPPDPMGRLLRRGEQRYLRLEHVDDVDGHVQEFIRRAYVLAAG